MAKAAPRSIEIEGDVAIVELTRGQVALIDAADVELVSSYRWYATLNVQGGYYAAATANRRTIYMHRLIADCPAGKHVDHIHHDTLDNRRSQLRILNPQENMQNRRAAYRSSRTGVRGVTFHRYRNGKEIYSANVVVNGKHYAWYFPNTTEGFEEAKACAQSKRNALMVYGSNAMTAEWDEERHRGRLRLDNTSGQTDVHARKVGGYEYWIAHAVVNGRGVDRYFPYTDEGFAQATTARDQMRAGIIPPEKTASSGVPGIYIHRDRYDVIWRVGGRKVTRTFRQTPEGFELAKAALEAMQQGEVPPSRKP